MSAGAAGAPRVGARLPGLIGVWRARAGLALAAIFVASFAAAADDNKIIFPAGDAHAAAPAAVAGASPVNSITLILGLALAGVGGWFVWRNRHRSPGGRDLRALAIDETRSLGNRQYLVVASYEGKKFLLGVCPGRIEMLTPLDERAARARTE